MADLLINPQLSTGHIIPYANRDSDYGVIMRTDDTNNSVIAIKGDWFAKVRFQYESFNRNVFNFYCGTGALDVNLVYHSNYYGKYLRQDFEINDITSFVDLQFNIQLQTRTRQMNGVFFEIGVTNGTSSYRYNAISGSWISGTANQNNILVSSFDLGLQSDNRTYIQSKVYAKSLDFPPITGDAFIMISYPYIDVDKFSLDNSFFAPPLGIGSTYTALAIDLVSLMPSNVGASPEIEGIETNNDNGTQNGSAIITAINGVIPYAYSLDNITYQSSRIFDNLAFGNYTAYVKDSNDLIDTEGFEIKSDIKYFKRLFGQLGNFTELFTYELWEANFTGTATERDLAENGLTLNHKNINDFLAEPIRGSSMDVDILAEDGDNYESIVSGSNRNAYITVRKDGEKFWQGWVMPSFFNETYASAPYNLKLSSRDGLGEFSENNFDNIDDYGVKVTGEIVIKDLFSRLLDSISIDSNIFVDQSIYTEIGSWYLHTININKYLEKNDSISDVINDILNSFSANLKQVNGDWYFTRTASYSRANLEYKEYDTKGNYLRDVSVDHKVQLLGSEILGTPTMMLQEPYKKIVIEQQFGKRESGNLNPEFEEWDDIGNNTWQLKDWNGISAGQVFTGEKPKEVTLNINPSGSDIYLSQFVNNVEAGGTFIWSTAVKLLGDLDTSKVIGDIVIAMRITITDGTTIYYFDASYGTWDTTEEDINLINFSSESGSESGYKKCSAFPVSGKIECRIYRNQWISYECSEFKIEFLDNDGNTYNNVGYLRDTINVKNRLTPDNILMNLSDVPQGFNNRLMYTGYIWDGEKTTNMWSDDVFDISTPLADILSYNIAQLKKSPYRRFSGSIMTEKLDPLKSIMVYDSLISSTTFYETTINVYLYKGYVFSGGSFNCYSSTWKGQWLEMYNAKITEVIINEVPEPPEVEILPSLLIDAANDLLIDDVNKLLL